MRKIQEAADEGKIGAILNKITGDKPPFSLDNIKVGEAQVTDKVEITRIITKLFRDWFFRSEHDAWRDHGISDAIICEDKDRFLEITGTLKVPPDIANKIWDSCRIKQLDTEARTEMDELDDYTPTYEQFTSFIKNANPRSAGGYNGMSYLMMQNLPELALKRMYQILLEAWKSRTPLEGWGDRWLVPIPKIDDPSLKDLRPIMLVDVIRKFGLGYSWTKSDVRGISGA